MAGSSITVAFRYGYGVESTVDRQESAREDRSLWNIRPLTYEYWATATGSTPITIAPTTHDPAVSQKRFRSRGRVTLGGC
jgi:hypothetical protein